jgi:hypothetical protein
MTSKQRISILAHRWPAACDVQGWNPNDRPLRLRVLSEAIGRDIESMNDLNNDTDIDKIFAHLGMLSENLKRTVDLTPAGQENGYRRRMFWLIRKHSRQLGGEPYVLALARDKFHLTEGLQSIEDLTTKQLNHLMMTLNARRQKKQHQEESLSSEETFQDDVEFLPETEAQLANEPF